MGAIEIRDTLDADPAPPVVRGRVLDRGFGVSDALVQLFVRVLRREELVAATRSDADGGYEATLDPTAGATVRRGAVELVVRVFHEDREEVLGEASTLARPGEGAVLDVILTTSPRSEFERLGDAIEPLLAEQGEGGRAIEPWELDERDTERLVAGIGIEGERVRAWVDAARAAQATPLEVNEALRFVAFYAWSAVGGPADVEDLLLRPVDELTAALEQATERAVIPSLPDEALDRLRTALADHQVEAVLRPTADGERASLGDVLDSLPPELALGAQERASLAQIAIAMPERGGDFWEAVEAGPLSAAQVAALRTTLAVEELGGGDATLLRALQAQLPAEPDGTLAHLAALGPNEWIAAVAEARPSESMIDVERVAAGLAIEVERRHPSAAFKAKLENETITIEGYPSADVASFLGEHRDFDLLATDVEPFLLERGLGTDDQLGGALLQAQRVLRLGATQSEAAALMSVGLTSAHALVTGGEQRVTAEVGSVIPAPRLALLRANAYAVLSGVLGVAGIATPTLSEAAITALPPPAADAALLSRFPSLGTLFGDQASCACRHCSSVLSPAAYLVDLLDALSHAGVEGDLRRRRPDIAELELTCENTNVELPYVDLVLEVLESATCFPATPIMLTAAEAAQLGAGRAPPSLRTALSTTVSSLAGDVTVTGPATAPQAGLPGQLTVRNGTRRWTARHWRDRLTASHPDPFGLPLSISHEIPEMHREAALEALRTNQLSPGLVGLLAPEPRLPVVGVPIVTPLALPPDDAASAGSEAWAVRIDRAVAVGFTPGAPVGILHLRDIHGAGIDSLQVQPGALVPMMAAHLDAGQVPQIIANVLPRLAYKIHREDVGGEPRWILAAGTDHTLRHDPDRLVLDGLAFSGSTGTGDHAVFPENRNPLAYELLRGADHPWTLPFDVFLDEVRACLAVIGTPRGELIRALRPRARNRDLADTCELLHTAPRQLERISEASPTAARSAALWGLAETGNVVGDPSDAGAPPATGGWVQVLSRLSILLARARLDVPALLGALGTRFVRAGADPPTLDPAHECKPSMVTVRGLDKDRLDRLHRLLRLRLITGWSLRDLDALIGAVTDGFTRPLTAEQVTALAALAELARRLDVGLRQAAAWIGPMETASFTDREAEGSPVLASLYAETFLRSQTGRTADAALALDPSGAELAYLTEQVAAGTVPPLTRALTDELARLGRALQTGPTQLRALIGPTARVADQLTLGGLTALYRHVSLARALGLSLQEHLLLTSLAGTDPFPDPAAVPAAERTRRLLGLCDLVDELKESGFSFDDLATAIGAAALDPSADRRRALDRERWLAQLREGLRGVPAVGDADVSGVEIRAELGRAAWPAACVDRVLAPGSDEVGLESALDLRVGFSAAAAPVVGAELPFSVSPGTQPGEFELVARLETLAVANAAAAFTSLASIAGLGPLTDASSAAARLRARWLSLGTRIDRLARWLQSVVLPRSIRPLTFTIPAPQGLADPGVPARLASRVQLAAGGELTVRGFLAPSERRALASWAAGAANLAAFSSALDTVPELPPSLASQSGRIWFDSGRQELVLVGYVDPGELAAFAALVDHPRFATAVQALAAAADAFVERRAGNRLMDAADVRELLLREPLAQRRLAEFHGALAQPLRRRLAARMAAERSGVDARLFDALDDAAQSAAIPRDVLAPLCAAAFVDADPEATPADAWVNAVTEVDRVGLLLDRLGVRESEAAWFAPTAGGGFTGLAELGFARSAAATLSVRFAAWRRGAALARLRRLLPGQAETLEAIRTAAANATLGETLAVIEQAYQLPADGGGSVLALDGLLTQPAELLDPLLLRRVAAAGRLLRRLGTTPTTSLSLCAASLTEAEARVARGLFIARHGPATGSAGLRAAMNRLRERQRAALVEHLVHRDGATDAADLHARYLLDVEMGAEMRTSRVKQAISSTQLFTQRWLMNLEAASDPAARDDVARTWEWTRSYRVWEANRNVYLFAQNWLEPSLRDDKTHLFRRFESTLLQSEVTSERAVQALRQYLDGLQEISRVTVLAMFRESRGRRAGTVHVVGRTAHHPAKYLYRQWRPAGAAGSWDPWQPLDVIGDTDHVVVFVSGGRPEIAWLQVDDAQSEDEQDDGSGRAPDPSIKWALQMQWSRLGEDGWSAPKTSTDKITHIKPINKGPATTFALRLESSVGGSPVIRCYGGSSGTTPPRLDPPPWSSTPTVSEAPQPPNVLEAIQLVEVQVLGKTGNRHLALGDAIVEIWASTAQSVLQFGRFVWGESSSPWRLANRDGMAATAIFVPILHATLGGKLTINVRVRFAGAADKKLSAEVTPLVLNTVKFGFVFDLAQTTSTSVNEAIDPNRRLRLFPLATADWGLGRSLRFKRDARWQQSEELLPAGQAEHFRSGFRFPANSAIEVAGTTLANPAAAEPVFVCASAGDNGPGLGLPAYVEAESAAASGFVTAGMEGALTFLPATEVTHVALQRALDGDAEIVSLPLAPPDPDAAGSVARLTLGTHVASPFDRSAPQFARALPYAPYDWEVCFHAPLMVAKALAIHQRYAEALRWLRLVFDPTHSDPAGAGASAWWRFPPFVDAGRGVGIDVLLAEFSAGRLDPEQQASIEAQLTFSRESPFRPHGIARMRVRAYQWMTILAYLDVLIAWGDQLFRRDTIESINEATQLYLLAGELLGPPPARMPERPRVLGPPTFAALAGEWDAAGNVWISLADTPFFKALLAWLAWLAEHGIVGPDSEAYKAQEEQLRRLASIGSLVFCVPRNQRLDGYWGLVADRLRKIRRSQNIEGVDRRLELFEPPLDPALLVRAVAAGLDIDRVLGETLAAPTPYRFSTALQTASELCAEVTSLGASLLGAWERRDGEELGRLRSTQELALLALTGDIRRRQLDEAEANVAALSESRALAEVRYRHFQRLLGKEQIEVPGPNAAVPSELARLQLASTTSDRVDAALRGYGLTLEEADQLGWTAAGNTYTLLGGAFQVASGIAHVVPNFTFTTPTLTSYTFGGSNVGSGLGAIGSFFSLLAANASFQANRSSIIGGHQRRYDDWVLQSNLAGKEIEQLDKQMLAAEIRADLAGREIAQHDAQVADARAVDEHMRTKFSRQELYQWTIERLTETHSAAYQIAYDLARRAERVFAFELGTGEPGIVGFGGGEGLRGRLLAGQRLSLDLKRLEAAYLDRNRRELEITKHVSLNQLDPLALLRLQTTGTCEFTIPELAYDIEFAGHYFRRIRGVSVSVPCVAGPYTSVAGTLTLLENEMRTSAEVSQDTDGAPMRRDLVPMQSIATSSGQNDAGLFELSFRDERYLPFEGAGAISRWRFELPAKFRGFDYGTIADLVIHIRYTARDGGSALKQDALRRVRAALEAQRGALGEAGRDGALVRAFSLRHDFATEWSRLFATPSEPQLITIGIDRFPFSVREETVLVWHVGVHARGAAIAAGDDAPVILHAPAAAYTGTDPQPAIRPPQVAVFDGGALYASDLESDDWTPVAVGADTPSTWQIELPTPAVPISDAVLAFWWRLG